MSWFHTILNSRQIRLKKNEFELLPADLKKEYLGYLIEHYKFKSGDLDWEFNLLSDDEKTILLDRIIKDTNSILNDEWFKFLSDEKKIDYLKDRLERGIFNFTHLQFEFFTPEMFISGLNRHRYFFIDEYVFNLMPYELKVKYINKTKYWIRLDYDWQLEFYREHCKNRKKALNRQNNINDIFGEDVHQETNNTL